MKQQCGACMGTSRPFHHDDVIKWKHFPRYWPFVRGIHRSPVNSPHKGQWRGALMFTLICARINDSVNNREAGDLRRHRAHYDVIVITNKVRAGFSKICFLVRFSVGLGQFCCIKRTYFVCPNFGMYVSLIHSVLTFVLILVLSLGQVGGCPKSIMSIPSPVSLAKMLILTFENIIVLKNPWKWYRSATKGFIAVFGRHAVDSSWFSC